MKTLVVLLTLGILGMALGNALGAQNGPRFSLLSLEHEEASGAFLVEMEVTRGIATAGPNADFRVRVTLDTGSALFEMESPVAALPSAELRRGGTSITLTIPATPPPGTYQVRVIGFLSSGQLLGTFSDAVAVVVQ